MRPELHPQPDGGDTPQREAAQCKVLATEADKQSCHGYYCVTIGCWREAGHDTEGQCSTHQKGPSGQGIKAALSGLLDTHRLGEAQFAGLRELLRRKLDDIG